MRRLLLVPTLGVAALVLTAPVQAQTRGWTGDGRAYSSSQQSFYDSGRVAYDNGFREGLKQGEKDGRKQDQFRYQDEKTFQRGDKGYQREYGSVERYRQSFRTGYSAGYSEAYQRYAPNYSYGGNGRYGNGRAVPRQDTGVYGYPNGYPSNPGTVYPSYPSSSGSYGRYGGYSDAAIQNGVNDGYEKGLEDARKNRSFDPLRQDWYRSGDRHYDSRYGSKEQYKDMYRQGFRDGYDRGFREGRYR
jgi:flagellar biosynthesis/type III secretory pathway protein FliH